MDIATLFDKFQILNDMPALKALVVTAAYLVLAKAADLLIDRVLKRLAGLTRVSFDDQVIGFLHTPICLTIAFLGFLHGLIILRPHEPWRSVLPAVIKTFILIVWWTAVIKAGHLLTERGLAVLTRRGVVAKDLHQLLKNVMRIILLVLGVIWALSIWKVNLTPLFASAGIAGIAIALAAKDTLANFFGGVSIFLDKAYKVGDYINLDTGERGEVVDIGIRSTRIKTRDDILITIPNSIMANARIINESAPVPRFRIRIPVGVAYGSNLAAVERILVDVAKDNPLVSGQPAPRARLRFFADSSINFELLCWVDQPAHRGLATHQLLNSIYEAFEQEGVTIPFPQRDVHLHGNPGKNAREPGKNLSSPS